MDRRVETIAGAAMRVGDVVISMKPPARHHTILHEMDRLGIDPFVAPDDQGFITSSGRFVDRQEGCVIARSRGQIIVKTGPADVLFSEDMW